MPISDAKFYIEEALLLGTLNGLFLSLIFAMIAFTWQFRSKKQ
jgi:hypothetical protein